MNRDDHDHDNDYHDDDDDDDGVDDDPIALELVIGYGWSQHLLSITVRHHITPSTKACIKHKIATILHQATKHMKSIRLHFHPVLCLG